MKQGASRLSAAWCSLTEGACTTCWHVRTHQAGYRCSLAILQLHHSRSQNRADSMLITLVNTDTSRVTTCDQLRTRFSPEHPHLSYVTVRDPSFRLDPAITS
jgi:hypothetical protein